MEKLLRVDKWLKTLVPGLTSSQGDEAIEAGLVLHVSGRKLKKGEKLGAGEIAVEKLQAHLKQIHQGNSGLEIPILYQEEGFVVVDKPAGIPSNPVSISDTETVAQWALARFPVSQREFPWIQPGLCPHRLDTGTSGVQIVTLTQSAYQEWRERFSEKKLEKTYLAWCWGVPAQEVFQNTSRIAHSISDARKMVALSASEEKVRSPIRDAETKFKVMKKIGDRFLVEARCTTGVTHQVRVHLASLGHPLVGDALYDSEFEARSTQVPYHLLRAVELKGSQTYSVNAEKFKAMF